VKSAPRFLSVDEILAIHAIAIEDQGGDAGLRDRALLESAVATPSQQFSGQFLHPDIPAMAAAYAFYICGNHPFIDGNKRAAVAAMIAFLSDNGWRFDATADEAEPIVLNLASGPLEKSAFTELVRKYMHEKPRLELREFFSRIQPDQFSDRFKSLLPAETGARPSEFEERGTEAAMAMPFLRDLGRQQRDAQQAGDQEGWSRVTMLAVGMMTLYALAEDMGYEW
jgi:death on curing protein